MQLLPIKGASTDQVNSAEFKIYRSLVSLMSLVVPECIYIDILNAQFI